ncbi:Putative Poly-beta-hydroxybutyrate polymerase (phbC, phaC) [Nostocoides japonicum T1-X7]|uniref:Poly(3-hydroxyalkanoate) polymerase subunit PhaC n=1 Tax=Nostocoides japonicum T1-X7 TaxID=1194083 RepID=A0A077LYQ0_9MICO|nr:class III poly(R)-hydroxyalkanoic acid synthase subunit PhaC [Tetrasphaera japonica]CCH79038.1 Putative Poly-beta-hydroxybutyrate polymerase (phbC, phaC) [Tetrasphaera japonica T1-X7]
MIPTGMPSPPELAQAAARFNAKVQTAVTKLGALSDEDVQIGATPKDLILQTDKVTLYRYRPLTEARVRTPVLIAYGLIGRQTMADLQEDRSLVRNLLMEGIDLWVVDWGSATRADRWLTIDDYVNGYLDDCVSTMIETTGMPSVTLLGICEGGVFSLAYAALYPERVQNLILTITPLDFHADSGGDSDDQGLINAWTRSLTPADVDRMIEVWGCLPGELMATVFAMITPTRSLTKYNLDLLQVVDNDAQLMNFLRMEKWLADRPDHPGEAAKQWLKELYQDNLLIRNEWSLGGRRIDLSRVTMPVLNIYAEGDTIIPPPTSRVLRGRVGTDDYSELGSPGGHIGVFVSRKSQGLVAGHISTWLRERDTEKGK